MSKSSLGLAYREMSNPALAHRVSNLTWARPIKCPNQPKSNLTWAMARPLQFFLSQIGADSEESTIKCCIILVVQFFFSYACNISFVYVLVYINDTLFSLYRNKSCYDDDEFSKFQSTRNKINKSYNDKLCTWS